jgi:hypothetical protein
MMVRRARWWLWAVLLLLVVLVTVGSLAFVFYSRDRDSAATLITMLAAVLTAGAGAATWLRGLVTRPRRAPLPLHRAADQLAERLRQQWEHAATERGLTRPIPIPLRWEWSSHRGVTSPRTEALTGRLPYLPGKLAATTRDLEAGTLGDLNKLYTGLGSGRIIVFGGPGSGKTTAGIRLLLDALADRSTLPAPQRAHTPVPVLLSPHGWDPTTEPFTTWLAATLTHDHALLRAPEYGPDTARRLIHEGHLSVILDGFDEIPETLRTTALRALNEQTTTFRLVLLTRTDELLTTLRSSGQHLQGAAAVELLPLTPQQAADYLTSTHTDPPPAPWGRLITDLRQDPDSPLARTLSTPLMLTLLGDTYQPTDPVAELLNTERFPTPDTLEDHLLDRVLTTAYTHHPGQPHPRYTLEQAHRWLAHLARHMNHHHTRDLAWWHIPRWTPAWPRALSTITLLSVALAFVLWVMSQFTAHIHFPATFEKWSPTAPAAVFGEALGYVFLFGFGLLLVSPPDAGFPEGTDRVRWSRADIGVILLLGLGTGSAAGLMLGLAIGLRAGLIIGPVSGCVVGLGFALGGGPPQRLGRLRWSSTDTHTNLRTGLVIGLVAGLVAELGYGSVSSLRFGLVHGFIVGIIYLLVILVGGRPALQRSQLSGSTTGTLIPLLVGLGIGTSSLTGYGIIYVLIVILAGRSPLTRGRPRWSKADTPTILLTGLAVGLICGPVYGLVYGLAFGTTNGLILTFVFGLAFGLVGGLILGLRQPPTEATSPLDPPSLWRRERQFGLGLGLVMGLVVGLVFGVTDGLILGSEVGLVYGLTDGLVVGLGSGLVSSATWAAALASAQLWRRGQAPVRLLRFLDDARQRQILRTVGPVYQFRHARLQDRLAQACQTVS